MTRHLTIAALALMGRERARLAVLGADSAEALVLAGVQFHASDQALWRALGNAIAHRIRAPFGGGQ